MQDFKKIPKRYHPPGYEIIYEDRDLIVGNKAEGFLSVRALWNKENSIHAGLNRYVRKGNSRSHKRVFVVHRLDQDTSGILIFAKTYEAQNYLKDNWDKVSKVYYTVVHGHLPQKEGVLSSYLVEDDDYQVHSTEDKSIGKFSETAFTVIKETERYSLLKIDLLTGRKNQIRVHFSEVGNPVVGDTKYGKPYDKYPHLALHSKSISLNHPFNGERLSFEASIPLHFQKLVGSID